jgi:hypothetical protein
MAMDMDMDLGMKYNGFKRSDVLSNSENHSVKYIQLSSPLYGTHQIQKKSLWGHDTTSIISKF